MNDTVLSKIKRKKSAFERYKQTREGKEYLEYRRQETQKKAKPEELSKIWKSDCQVGQEKSKSILQICQHKTED